MSTVVSPPLSHLSEKAQAALMLEPKKRIAYIRKERWFGYPKAKLALDMLEDLLSYPKQTRMPNLLLVADSNNGKTTIAKRFLKLHPTTENNNGDGLNIPVFYMQAPSVPDEGRFYSIILDRLFAPYKATHKVEKKQSQALRLLENANLGVFIIDEIHNILAGPLAKQRQLLNTIKYIGNELMTPVIGVGTKDAFRAIQTDPQLSNRFDHVFLNRWNYDENYLKLLQSFELTLPLKEPSFLAEPKIAQRILALSEGLIGEINNLLVKSAVYSVRHNIERISEDVIKSIHWTPPSKRARQL